MKNKEIEELLNEFKKGTLLISEYREKILSYIEQLENNRDKAIEYNQEIVDNYLEEDDCEYCDGRYNVANKNLNILKGDSDG